LESGAQRRPVRRRIPFHQQELGAQTEFAALESQRIDEVLHALEHASAVVVVPRYGDDAKMRRHAKHPGSA
jgi:hypothetical protein